MTQLEKDIKRIDLKLTALLGRKKETWVKAKWIQSLTGWDGEKMRQAREDGLIQFRVENGYEYLLESLNEKFIK